MSYRPIRIMLTGSGGQVGWELNRALISYGIVGAYGSGGLDMLDGSSIREKVRGFRPDVIVNAAAYTAVDKAESERAVCRGLNATAPGILAEEAEKLGAWIIHYSTDYVYSGKNDRPWREDDEPNPGNFYGESKLEGDMAVSGRASRHLIFRTSWVYSSRRSNFLLTMLRLFAPRENGEKRVVRVVDDQIGAPTLARVIAQATVMALGRAVIPDDEGVSGVYHVACGGSTSWCGFAREILGYAGARMALGNVELVPISSDEYAACAARPAWSVLSTERASAAFGFHAAQWQGAARLCMDEIAERR